METVSKDCPTGILIDIDLQTDSSSVKNENNSNHVLIEDSEEKHIDEDTKLRSWLDQSPPKLPPRLIQKVFCTPKSDWKTPSPKSMKIINREASRIVDRLHSSPVDCSEVMLDDEVFPAVKSLDYDCFDEFHIKSKSFTTEKLEQCNPNSLDFKKCTISALSIPISECNVSSDEKLSIVELQSDIKLKEHHCINEKKTETVTPENATNQSYTNDEMIKSATCVANLSPDAPECVNVSSDNILVSKHEITVQTKMPAVSKVFSFKTPVKHAEKNKGNVFQYKGTSQHKEGSRFFKKEKSASIDDEPKETKIGTSRISRNVPQFEQSLKRNIIAHPSTLETQKCKVKQSLEKNNVFKSMIGKPGALQQKSNVVRSQTFSSKRDPLCKTMTALEIPNATSSVRRSISFQLGSTRNAIPAVEKKITPVTASSYRILKPKMSLNQVSNIGNGLSTPLKFGTGSQNSKLAYSCSTNPIKRKSLAFQSNYSLAASNIKVAAQNDENYNPKKPVVSTSSRLRFVKKVDLSFQSKFKNDTLSRKLFS